MLKYFIWQAISVVKLFEPNENGQKPFRVLDPTTVILCFSKNVQEKKNKTKKALEAAHIIARNTFNSMSGFVMWSTTAVKQAVG